MPTIRNHISTQQEPWVNTTPRHQDTQPTSICKVLHTADELIVGKRAEGAHFTGSNLENHPQYGDKLVYDQPSGNNLYLSGKPGDPVRYVLPIDPKTHEGGWGFNVNRDYLLPLQPRILSLTNNEWKQNPSW